MARDSWVSGRSVLKAQGPQQIVLPEEEEETFNMNATYLYFRMSSYDLLDIKYLMNLLIVLNVFKGVPSRATQF